MPTGVPAEMGFVLDIQTGTCEEGQKATRERTGHIIRVWYLVRDTEAAVWMGATQEDRDHLCFCQQMVDNSDTDIREAYCHFSDVQMLFIHSLSLTHCHLAADFKI